MEICKKVSMENNTVLKMKEALPKEETLEDLAMLFKVLGDPTRVKILSCLAIQSVCVMDIANSLDMTKSAVSHQLRILRQAKLVKGKKVGKEVYYSLEDDHVVQIFECGLSHINE